MTELFPWAHFDVLQEQQEPVAEFLDEPRDPDPAAAGHAAQGELLQIRPKPPEEGPGNQIVLPRLFRLGVQVPGALHVLHHSVEELTDAFQEYKDWFLPRLQAVTKILGKKYNRERFVTEVLRGTQAEVFEQSVLNLELNLREARWGTLMSTCKALLAVRLVFAFWDAEK